MLDEADAGDNRSFLFAHLQMLVRSGLVDASTLFRRADDMAEGDAKLARMLRGFVANRLREQDALEATWHERTCNDNLDDAFAALNARGVVALQNAGWTMTTGWEDANEEIARREAAGECVLGATFYHEQDLERGVAGEGLMLVYGACDGSDEKGIALGHLICAVLTEHGIATKWDGDIRVRIAIQPFVWRKRRTTAAPPRPVVLPTRCFRHPDGRRWTIAAAGHELQITIVFDDGETISRKRPTAHAQADLELLVDEQLADGFIEEHS
jgi:hypothetical protein